MKASAFFEYKCPNCNSTVDIGVSAGGDEQLCPNCKTKMIPNPKGTVSSANVHCSKCNSSFGLINSDKCPNCGKAFSG
jgi:DNA-directed RNA polymerase subunit RPC12/RpoP